MYSAAFLSAFVALVNVASVRALIPDSVEIDQRNNWCTSQMTQCPLICLQYPGTTMDTQMNDCDAETLQFSCVCSNGITPNTSEYSLTIPYFICTETNNQCVAACGNHNNACADRCRTQNPCGAQSPTRANNTSSSTSSSSGSPTSTSNPKSSDVTFGGDGSKNTGKDGPQEGTASALGRAYGTVGILGVAAVAFGLFL